MIYLFFTALILLLLLFPKIIKNPVLGAAFLVFLLPFERIPSYDLPFLWGITVRLSQILALFLIVFFFCNVLLKRVKVKFDLRFFLFFLYIVVSFLSIFIAQDKSRAILVWGFTVFVILTAVVISYLAKKKEDLKLIEKFLLLSTFIVTIFGIVQFLGSTFGIPDSWLGLRVEYAAWTKEILGFPRIQSFSLEPLYYANFLLIPFSLFFVSAFRNPNKKYLSILFLISLNFVLTFSRGIYLAWAVTFLAALFFARQELVSKKALKIIGTIFLGAIMAIAMIAFSSFYTNKNFSKIEIAKKHATSVTDQSISVGERETAWENATKAFLSSPLLGIGIGNFGPWEAGYPKEVPKGGWNIVNNEPLEILTETGILGFLSLFAALGYLFFKAIKAFQGTDDPYFRVWFSGLLIALLGIAAQYQTFSTLYIMHVWVAIGLLFACVNLIDKQNAIQKSNPQSFK